MAFSHLSQCADHGCVTEGSTSFMAARITGSPDLASWEEDSKSLNRHTVIVMYWEKKDVQQGQSFQVRFRFGKTPVGNPK